MRFRVPDAFAVLGTVLELTVEEGGKRRSFEFKRPYYVAADAGKKTVWLIRSTKKTKPVADPRAPELREVEQVFRMWFDFEPRRGWSQPLKVAGDWQYRGEVVRIRYRSDKWHAKKQENYEHQFSTPPGLHQLDGLYRMSGPALKVTPSGIHG